MAIKEHCGVRLCAMVKADAYGHGLAEVASSLEGSCDFFGVARIGEAKAIRELGVKGDILVCSELGKECASYACRNGVTLTLCSALDLDIYEKEAERQKSPLNVHIKVDSGMNRLGLKSLRDLERLLKRLKKSRYVSPTGIYTHFADCTDSHFTIEQFELFSEFADAAKQYFPQIIAHCASSAAIFSDKRFHLDMVRPGINLYGYSRGKAEEKGVSLKPAMQVYSQVIAVKSAKKGESVGYSRTFRTEEDISYAVIGAGYGDGFRRALSNRGKAEINGALCDIIGNVCMDCFMVKLSKRAKAGDEALLFSDEAGKELSFEYNSGLCGTICYELLTSFTARADRIYIQ